MLLKVDKDVFEGYTLEAQNGWKKENSTDTFLFDKETGITRIRANSKNYI